MNPSLTNPSTLLVALAAIGVTFFYCYRIYANGGFRGPWYLIPLLIVASIGILYASYEIKEQQSLILLLLPAVFFVSERWLRGQRLTNRQVTFVCPKELDYASSLYGKLAGHLTSSNATIRLSKCDFGGLTGLTQSAATRQAAESDTDLIIIVVTQINDELFQNIKLAHKRKVPVILVDYPVELEEFVSRGIASPAHISSDFDLGGKLAAQIMLSEIGEAGNVIIVSGPRESVPSELRKKAFINALADHAPQVCIVQCGYVNEWSADEAVRVYRHIDLELTRRGTSYAGVFCCNDTLALAVASVLSNKYVVVVGYDGVDAAQTATKERVLAGTIDVQIEKQASMLLDEMRRALANPLTQVRQASIRTLVEPIIRQSPKSRSRITLYKAILFDMDGLMLDNEQQQLESFNAVLSAYQVKLTEVDWRRYVGMSQRNIFLDLQKKYAVLEQIQVTELMRLKQKAYYRIIESRITPTKGLMALLQYLKSVPNTRLAVVSSSPRTDIVHILDRIGVDRYFDEIISALDMGKPKPDKDCYVAAAHALGLRATACLSLEDSSVGVQAAIAAGMHCIAVPNQFTVHQDLSRATRTVSSLDELVTYLQDEI